MGKYKLPLNRSNLITQSREGLLEYLSGRPNNISPKKI